MNQLAFGASFVLGALDGISPGHGKSVIAAVLVAERMDYRKLAAFFVSLLFSHFFLLLILAFLLQTYFADGHLPAWIEWIGPVAVILFGFYLYFRYNNTKHTEACDCGHDHGEEGHHHHHHHSHTHEDVGKASKLKTFDWTRFAVFGFLLGLLPCPMAISTLFLSMSADGFSSAVPVIAMYVLGMALVLAGITLFMALGRDQLNNWIDRLGSQHNLRRISAILVILIGIAYLIINAMHLNHVHVA
jgi:nickel/cobalt exporter